MKFKLFLFLLILFLVFPAFTFAQEKSNTFSISPFFQDLTLEENQLEKVFSVEVENQSQDVAVFRIYPLDFGTLDKSGGVAFLGEKNDFTEKYGLSPWMRLEKDAIVLDPGEKQKVKVTIENKETLTPGGHYGAIIFKEEKDKSSEDVSDKVVLDQSFSSLIFLRKVGGEKYGLNLKNYQFKKNFFYFPKEVLTVFQNTGNVHIVPHGSIRIFDPLGREVKRGIINPESGIILPESERNIFTDLTKSKNSYLPGYYFFTVDYRYQGNEMFATKKEKIFFVPSFSILGIILIILAVAFFWKIKKIRKNKKEI